MNLLSDKDRKPLKTPLIRLVDPSEKYEWTGRENDSIWYRRMSLADYELPDASYLDAIKDWRGFRLDGAEIPYCRDLADALPQWIKNEIEIGINAICPPQVDKSDIVRESILYYRVPFGATVDRLRKQATVRGAIDIARYSANVVRWALMDWEGVLTSEGNPADYNPDNINRLPNGAIGLLFGKLIEWIAGIEERQEAELKNSMPTSGDSPSSSPIAPAVGGN